MCSPKQLTPSVSVLTTLPFLLGIFKPYDYEMQELRQREILPNAAAPSRFLVLIS